MKIRNACSEEAERPLNAVDKDDSLVISPKVTEDLEQLEKLLEKACRVRQTLATHADSKASTSEGSGRTPSLVNAHKNHSQTIRKVNCEKMPTQVSKAPSHVKATHRIHKAHRQTTRGGQTETLKSGGNSIQSLNSRQTKVSFDKTCTQDTVTSIKQRTQQKNSSSGDDLCRTTTLRPPDADVKATVEEKWFPSPLLQSWTTMRSKQSRLWDKVLIKGTQAVPEKMHFTQKLQSTFPKERLSDAPAEASSRVDFLTELGKALNHCHHAELRISQSSSEEDPRRRHESEAMLDGLEVRMMTVLGRTEQLIRALDKYQELEPGVLCAVRRKSAWEEPQRPCLPPTVCYHSQAELQEIAQLRLRVQALEQDMKLQQILRDLSCSSPSCSPAHIRGQYSLLGEGGLHFPTLIMDTEPD